MSLYDSGWGSMIISPHVAWLLLESFQYVSHQQFDRSGWVSNPSDVDLDTSAAILEMAVRLAKEDDHSYAPVLLSLLHGE